MTSEINWQPGVTLADIEKQVIQKAYSFFEGNKTKTAQALGIAIRTLDNKLMIYEGRLHGSPGSNSGISISIREGQEEAKANCDSPNRGVHVESDDKISEKQAVHVRERDKIQKVSSR